MLSSVDDFLLRKSSVFDAVRSSLTLFTIYKVLFRRIEYVYTHIYLYIYIFVPSLVSNCSLYKQLGWYSRYDFEIISIGKQFLILSQ